MDKTVAVAKHYGDTELDKKPGRETHEGGGGGQDYRAKSKLSMALSKNKSPAPRSNLDLCFERREGGGRNGGRTRRGWGLLGIV